MVSDVTISTALNQQQNTSASSDALASDFSQFLTLLTVQLQNQDPLSPMETNEFTSQLVAFSGVEQQINTNQKLDSIVALNLSNTMGTALNYVGLDANYVSSEFYYDGSKPATIKYAYDGEPLEATIRVLDENGTIVYEQDAEKGTGNNEFVWDGKNKLGQAVPEGTYEIRVDALDYEGEAVDVSTVVQGNIRGVETQNGAIYVLIGDRAVSVGNILNVSQPRTVTTTDATDTTDTTTSG